MSGTTTMPAMAATHSASSTKRRRQRSPSPPAPRKKSCEACRKAKARCSETLPKCSRCERKGIACDYGGTRNEDSNVTGITPQATDFTGFIGSNISNHGAIPDAYLNALSGNDALGLAGAAGGSPFDNVYLPTAHSSSEGSPEDGAGSSNVSSNGSSRGYQTSMTSNSESPEPMNIDPALYSAHQDRAQNWNPAILPFTMVSRYRDDGTKELEIFPNITDTDADFNPRFMGFNVEWPSECVLGANRVIGAFKVWPSLMIKCDTLPSFIHPHYPGCQVSDATSVAAQSKYRPKMGVPPKLPEPLANCSSICTMFYNKTTENSPFVWKNIKREQERIYNSYRKWQPREVLSSFQSMLIYSFLRMIDGEHDHNNFDMAFVLTVSEVGTTLWGDNLRALQARSADPSQVNWADWMLAESTVRTGMVFQFMFIMLQLYKALPPTPGCRGIDDMALPCGRKLWQASSYSEWLEEYKNFQASRKSSRVLKFGDIRALLPDSKIKLTPEEREDLVNWASDLDDFGNLTLIAGLSGKSSRLEDYRRTHLQVIT